MSAGASPHHRRKPSLNIKTINDLITKTESLLSKAELGESEIEKWRNGKLLPD